MERFSSLFKQVFLSRQRFSSHSFHWNVHTLWFGRPAIEQEALPSTFRGHVVLPGTPEHRNTGTPEHHGTFRNNRKTRNTPQKTRNTPKKTRKTPRKPGTPQDNSEHPQENQEHPRKSPEHPEKNPEISKSRWRANMLPRAWASLNYRHWLHIK